MKKYKVFLLFVGLFIFNFCINYFSISNNDLIWNYGFCYNISKGLKMYADFNMVITPLYPTVIGLIMKLLGSNMIIFFLINSLIPTMLFYIVYKYYNKAFIEVIILTSFVSHPNYSLLCLLFLFILFILEDNKKNDYLIGLVLGLNFLTKSPMGLLSLASLYYIKDIKKILKRVVGFLIPNIVFIIYFYFNNTLAFYINYAFGSLFDFASKNANSGLGLFIFIVSVIYLIYLYKNKKDIKILYILFFQIMSYPIFNLIHIIYSLIPIVFYICINNKNKIYNKYRKYLSIILICPILCIILQLMFMDMEYGTSNLKYKLVESKYINDSIIIKDNVRNLNNTYFIMYESYYNKLLLNIDINKYDVMLNGNLGFNGEDNTIKYFKSLKSGTQFLLYSEYEGGQAPKKVYDYIKDNYKMSKSFDKYELYVK